MITGDAVRTDRDAAVTESWLWNAARWPHPFDYSDLGPEPVHRRRGSQVQEPVRRLSEYEEHVATLIRQER